MLFDVAQFLEDVTVALLIVLDRSKAHTPTSAESKYCGLIWKAKAKLHKKSCQNHIRVIFASYHHIRVIFAVLWIVEEKEQISKVVSFQSQNG